MNLAEKRTVQLTLNSWTKTMLLRLCAWYMYVCVCIYPLVCQDAWRNPCMCVCGGKSWFWDVFLNCSWPFVFIFMLYVYVYTCLSEGMCVCEHPGHGACVKNRKQLSGVGSSSVYGLGDKLTPSVLAVGSLTGRVSCSTFYFEIGSFINLWAHQFRYTSWPASSVDPLPPTPLQITDVGAILGR